MQLLHLLEKRELPEDQVALLCPVDEAVHVVGILDNQRLDHVAALFSLLFKHVTRVIQGV